MGKHSFGIALRKSRKAMALFLVISQTLLAQHSYGSQAGSAMSGFSSMLATMLGSQAAGASSIASGNSNVSQGQSTQNQAQMAMGMMQIAMGLLGLLAAAAAAAKANKNKGNESKLGSTSDYSPNSYQSTIQPNNPRGTNSTGSSNLDSGASDLGVNPDDLRKGDLGQSMNILEKNFGISRDEFLNSLKNGADPREILARAPKNTPSLDTLNRIADGIAANAAAGAGDASRAIASTGGGDTLANPGGGVAQGPLVESKETAEDAAKAAAARLSIGKTTPDEDEDEDEINRMNVSPEIKAALLAKAAKAKAERDMRDSTTWSIFQLVHSRYRKLETMLYGRVERTNVPAPSEASRGF